MSINDIAKHLKVSKSTVSLVINGKAEKGRISKALAKTILDYVEKIGYKPNALAKSLATGKTHTIGLIVENIGDSFFGPIALHIEEILRKRGFHVFYSSTLGDSDMANEILNMMIEKNVDAIILSPTLGQEKYIQNILEKNIPLVIFDRRLTNLKTNYIGTDNYSASKKAVQHLFDKGFRTIGLVTIESQQSQMLDRLRGYEEIIAAHYAKSIVLTLPYNDLADQNNNLIKDFLIKNPNLDALYFSTNYLCVKTLRILQEENLIPQMGLISFDDHELFEIIKPTITCIRQPLESLSFEIVNAIVNQVNSKSSDFVDVIIPSQLIIRDSTKK